MLSNFNATRWVVFGMLLAGHALPRLAYGQPAGQGDMFQPARDRSPKIYTLQNAGVDEIGEILKGLQMSAHITLDARSQSIIAYADAETQDMIAGLITQLDVPAKSPGQTVGHITLLHRDPEEIANVLQQIAGSRTTRIAVDQANKLIIVKGRSDEVADAQKTALLLDQPRRSLSLTFYFVQGTIGGGAGSGGAKLPQGLEKVAAALERSGFGNLSLMAPLTTIAQESSEFMASGCIEPPSQVELTFEVQGEVDQSASPDSINLSVRAEVFRGRGDSLRSLFNVQTSMTAKLGDYVVLAAAPGSQGENNAVALVVRAD